MPCAPCPARRGYGSSQGGRYYKAPEATAASFTADGWFQTGDTAALGGSAEELAALVAGAEQARTPPGRAGDFVY